VSEAQPDKDEFAGLPPDWVVCNCSHCGCLLSGRSMRPGMIDVCGFLLAKYPPLVAGDIKGRPLCAGCHSPRKPKRSKPATRDDAPPSWDDAVRALEEDR
jgi:hypothetical protein